MSSVVNRLRAHLSEQVAATFKNSEPTPETKQSQNLIVELPAEPEQRRDPHVTLH